MSQGASTVFYPGDSCIGMHAAYAVSFIKIIQNTDREESPLSEGH